MHVSVLAVDLALTSDCANKIFFIYYYYYYYYYLGILSKDLFSELFAVGFCEHSFVTKLGMMDSVVDY